MRLQSRTVTNGPKLVPDEVHNSFQRQHNTEDEELSAYTEELILHLDFFAMCSICTCCRVEAQCS